MDLQQQWNDLLKSFLLCKAAYCYGTCTSVVQKYKEFIETTGQIDQEIAEKFANYPDCIFKKPECTEFFMWLFEKDFPNP